MFTIRPFDYVIEVAPAVLTLKRPDAEAAALLGSFHGQELRLPSPEFLVWHRDRWLG